MVDNWTTKTFKSKRRIFFLKLGIVLNNCLCQYEHIIVLGDFNLTIFNKHLADFMALFNLESLVNTPICLQSEKLRCISLILTNKKSLFNNFKPFELGITDHHHLVLTSMRS